MNKREIVTKYENTIYAIIATDEVLKDLKQLMEKLQKGGFGDVFTNPLFEVEEVD